MPFEKVVTDITEIFPKNEEIFSREFSDVDEFMERLSQKTAEILEENWFDITSEDDDVTELRHVLKNLALRVNKVRWNTHECFRWIDICHSNIKALFLENN